MTPHPSRLSLNGSLRSIVDGSPIHALPLRLITRHRTRNIPTSLCHRLRGRRRCITILITANAFGAANTNDAKGDSDEEGVEDYLSCFDGLSRFGADAGGYVLLARSERGRGKVFYLCGICR